MMVFLPPAGVLYSGNSTCILTKTTRLALSSRRPDENRPAQSFCMQLLPVPSLPSSRHCDHGPTNWLLMQRGSATDEAAAARLDINNPRRETKMQIASLVSAERQSDLHALACVAKSRRPIAVCGHRSPAHQPIKRNFIRALPFQLARRSPPAAPEHWVAERERAPRKSKVT
jgi:hypothetical protein